jgi:hypothetical protein
MSPICQGRKRFQGKAEPKNKNKKFDLWLRDPYCSDPIHRPRIILSAGDEITIMLSSFGSALSVGSNWAMGGSPE